MLLAGVEHGALKQLRDEDKDDGRSQPPWKVSRTHEPGTKIPSVSLSSCGLPLSLVSLMPPPLEQHIIIRWPQSAPAICFVVSTHVGCPFTIQPDTRLSPRKALQRSESQQTCLKAALEMCPQDTRLKVNKWRPLPGENPGVLNTENFSSIRSTSKYLEVLSHQACKSNHIYLKLSNYFALHMRLKISQEIIASF